MECSAGSDTHRRYGTVINKTSHLTFSKGIFFIFFYEVLLQQFFCYSLNDNDTDMLLKNHTKEEKQIYIQITLNTKVLPHFNKPFMPQKVLSDG